VNPRPLSAAEAVRRARELVASPENQRAGYMLGDGDWRPGWTTPWTSRHGILGGDCRVAFLWSYAIPADRPGYNHGAWSTCADCVSYNSLLEDAEHGHDLVELVTDAPREGDILAYPTIHLQGHPQPFIGHGAIVVSVGRWDGQHFGSLDIMQVCGGPARKPAAILSDGHHFDDQRAQWPKPEHRSRLIRVRP
jgi:hypothetical protein